MSRVPPARSTRLGTTTPKGRNPPGPLALGMPRSGQRRSTVLLPRSPDGGWGTSAFSSRDGKAGLIDPWFEGNPKAPGGAGAAPKADLMLLTHDHFDHAGDAVALARKTGALVVGIFELAGDLKGKGAPEA